jgi:steroid delta-isomerase-like uncharacterized protein
MSDKMGYNVLHRFLDEGFNRGDMDVLDELIAPDMIEHEELPPGVPPGREGVRHFFRMIRQAFPDIKATIDDELVQGDKVVVRSTWRGTHRGEFFGIPPTGKPVAFEVIDIARVRDGQVVEHWGVTDNLKLMQQLGVVPAPGQAET